MKKMTILITVIILFMFISNCSWLEIPDVDDIQNPNVCTPGVDCNEKPVLSFVEPANGITVGADIGASVNASDIDGLIIKVDLYINNSFVRSEFTFPYEWGTSNISETDSQLLNRTDGTYELRAEAIDDDGDSASATINVTVDTGGGVPTISNQLLPGESIETAKYLESSNGEYRFYLQGDGNLVLRNHITGDELWSSSTSGLGGTNFKLQGDSNLVLYTDTKSPVWDSKTVGTGATELRLNDDGSLILYNGTDIIWSVNYAPPTTGWKFIVYGDTRTNDGKHRSVLQSIVNNTPDYEFIINVGDVVNDGKSTSQWNTWKNACDDILGGLGQNLTPPKYMSTPGNHDELDRTDGRNNWSNFLPGQEQYGNDGYFFTFDYENARFIVMSSSDHSLTGSQLTMLNNAIATNTKTWLFAIWHDPIFIFGAKSYRDDIHEQWGKKLYQAGCDIIFMGHAHYYVRTHKLNLNGNELAPLDSSGTAQIITGNAANEYDLSYNSSKDYMIAKEIEHKFGYTELIVEGNTMYLRHILNNGTVEDEETYTANPK